jgi:hypothetical protein
MNQSQNIRFFKRCYFLGVLGGILMISNSLKVNGQEFPPRPLAVTVSLSQNLSFGAFFNGNAGGSVIIYPTGSRSSTGDVVLLNIGYTFSSGLYNVVANPGTIVSVLNGPDAILSCSNGGSMTVKL